MYIFNIKIFKNKTKNYSIRKIIYWHLLLRITVIKTRNINNYTVRYNSSISGIVQNNRLNYDAYDINIYNNTLNICLLYSLLILFIQLNSSILNELFPDNILKL